MQDRRVTRSGKVYGPKDIEVKEKKQDLVTKMEDIEKDVETQQEGGSPVRESKTLDVDMIIAMLMKAEESRKEDMMKAEENRKQDMIKAEENIDSKFNKLEENRKRDKKEAEENIDSKFNKLEENRKEAEEERKEDMRRLQESIDRQLSKWENDKEKLVHKMEKTKEELSNSMHRENDKLWGTIIDNKEEVDDKIGKLDKNIRTETRLREEASNEINDRVGRIHDIHEQICFQVDKNKDENKKQIGEICNKLRIHDHDLEELKERETPRNFQIGWENCMWNQEMPYKFEGKKQESPMLFLKNIEEYFNDIKDNKQRMRLVRKMLKGNAELWYNLVQEQCTDYKHFKELFTKQYWSDVQQNVIREEFSRAKYDKNYGTSREIYVMKKYQIARYFTPPMNEQEIVQYLARQLENNVAENIILQNIDNITSLLQFLRRYDAYEQHQNSYEKREFNPRNYGNDRREYNYRHEREENRRDNYNRNYGNDRRDYQNQYHRADNRREYFQNGNNREGNYRSGRERNNFQQRRGGYNNGYDRNRFNYNNQAKDNEREHQNNRENEGKDHRRNDMQKENRRPYQEIVDDQNRRVNNIQVREEKEEPSCGRISWVNAIVHASQDEEKNTQKDFDKITVQNF